MGTPTPCETGRCESCNGEGVIVGPLGRLGWAGGVMVIPPTCGECSGTGVASGGPDADADRYPPNDAGHCCRRDAVVDGICVDCERAPHSRGDAAAGAPP